MKNNYIEVFTTIMLVLLAVLILNPFSFWMPDMMVMGILVGTLVVFGMFASFVLREKAEDERDALHKSLAGRNAFLAGAGVLMLGILIEGYNHAVDPWLVGGLIVMIVAKVLSRFWSDRNL